MIVSLLLPRTVLAAEGGGIELPAWMQFGVLGLVIIALVVTKQLVPGWIHAAQVADLKAEIVELKLERRQLIDRLFDTQKAAIPALGDATKAIDEALNAVRTRGR